MKSKKGFIGFAGTLCLALVCLTLSVWLLFTPNSFSVEMKKGVVEISQKDVPLVITRPGSYCLMSNLTVSSPTATAILVAAPNVTIDLNGFTISGPGKYTGEGSFGINTNCTDNVVVRNGAIKLFGNVALHLTGPNNRAENVLVTESTHGIFVGRSGVVNHCQVAFCGAGINCDDGSTMINNTIYNSDLGAINTSGSNPPVGGNTVIGNNIRGVAEIPGALGISVRGQGNRIEGNTITLCGTGIDLSDGSDNYFAKNLLQGNGTAIVGDEDDTNGGTIDPALSNIILP